MVRPKIKPEIREEIIKLFLETEAKSEEIAQNLNLSGNTVLSILKEAGIYYRKKNKKRELTEECKKSYKNRRLYIDFDYIKAKVSEGYTLVEIGEELGIASSTLYQRMKEEKIEIGSSVTRHRNVKGKYKQIVDKYLEGYYIQDLAREYKVDENVITKILNSKEVKLRGSRLIVSSEEIAELYKENISVPEIAKLYDVAETTVYHRLREVGVDTSVKKNRDVLNNKDIEIIEGELLGDGSLGRRSNKSNTYFSFLNTKRDYVEFLKDNVSILKDRYISIRKSRLFIGRTGKPYIGKEAYTIRSLNQECLNSFYERWYPEGKKIVPRDLVLTPITVRHWYYGDGHLNKDKYQIQLCTNGFTKEDVEFLVDLLKNEGLSNARLKQDNYQGSISYSIIISSKVYVEKFLEYIGECVVTSMHYKHQPKIFKIK